MVPVVSAPDQNIALEVRRAGYWFGRCWKRDVGTLEAAESIGSVIDIQRLLPGSGIPTVQLLKPCRKSEAPPRQYSSEYGLGVFPLHTDLAHWNRPPRYLLLRCLRGAPSVQTSLLPASALDCEDLQRALARAKSRRMGEPHCLLPISFGEHPLRGFRWDPLFIVPANGAGRRVAAIMAREEWDRERLVEVGLYEPADTLILDNWRYLHGRSGVDETGLARCLERVYLSRFH